MPSVNIPERKKIKKVLQICNIYVMFAYNFNKRSLKN